MQIPEYFCGILLSVFAEAKWFDFMEGICTIVLFFFGGGKETLKVERILSVHI